MQAEWEAGNREPCLLYFAYRLAFESANYRVAYKLVERLLLRPDILADEDVQELLVVKSQWSEYGCEFTLKVEGSPPPGSPLQIEARYLGAGDSPQETSPGRTEVFSLDADLKSRRLTAGYWRFRIVSGNRFRFPEPAAAPGDSETGRTVLVDACVASPPTLKVQYRPLPSPAAMHVRPSLRPLDVRPRLTDEDLRRRLVAVELGLGGAATIAGVAVVAVTGRGWQKKYDRPVEACSDEDSVGIGVCRREIAAATQARSLGAGILGAGVGLVASGLLLRFRRTDGRRDLLPPVLGGVTLLGGVVTIAVSTALFNQSGYGAGSDLAWSERKMGSMVGHTVGAALLGFGAGALTGALTRLLWRRSRPPAPELGATPAATLRAVPLRLPGGAGFGLAGRF